jgi:hypothetical protein
MCNASRDVLIALLFEMEVRKRNTNLDEIKAGFGSKAVMPPKRSSTTGAGVGVTH